MRGYCRRGLVRRAKGMRAVLPARLVAPLRPEHAGQRRILFRRNTDRFGKRLQKIAVIAEAAGHAGVRNRRAARQQLLGNRNALGRNITVQRRAGFFLENLADVRTAHIKIRGELLNRQLSFYILIDIGKNRVNLLVVGDIPVGGCFAVGTRSALLRLLGKPGRANK